MSDLVEGYLGKTEEGRKSRTRSGTEKSGTGVTR